MLALLKVPCLALFVLRTFARHWNNTGKGAVVFEEAWAPVELLGSAANTPLTPGIFFVSSQSVFSFHYPISYEGSSDNLTANLLDVHNQRLARMDATGVDYPCIQGISDPVTAQNRAIQTNNELAEIIKNNTFRFGAFASLSMHNASEAAEELERTIKVLGFLGALLNDYQQSDADNSTLLYYDQPEYDVFWKKVTELDVPVYFHPRENIPILTQLEFGHAPWLEGPAQEFAVSLSNHILGLCTNGVFDRFPKLKIIVGHLGERIPSDLDRIDTQLLRQISLGMPMKKNVTTYWRTNLFETTSGNFATNLLKFHIGQIGLDRILYSIDYPFVTMESGAQWIDNELRSVLSREDLIAFKRERAIELLGLNK